MGRLGFGRTSLWMLLLEPDGTPVPHVVEIDEIPARPDDTLDGLRDL